MLYKRSNHHVILLPQGMQSSMHRQEMWQNHEHHLVHSYDGRVVPTFYQTPSPTPLQRMSALSNFSDESVSVSREIFQVMYRCYYTFYMHISP